MKRLLAFLVAIALSAAAFLPLPARAQGRSQESKGKFRKAPKAIPDQYIVVLKDDLPRRDVASVAADLAGFHGGMTGHVYTHALKGFSVQLPEAAAIALSQHPRVEYVIEDAEVSIPEPPSVSPSGWLGGGIYQPPTDGIYYDFTVTQYNPPWGLDRIDQRDPTPYWATSFATYTYTNTGAGVNVYNLDTGIRPTHQEFGGRAILAADFVGDGWNGQDCTGHGTSVASIIGGSTYGVAKGVRIHSVRVWGCGPGNWATFIAGIDWVTANHIKPAVANIEIASYSPYDAGDAAVRGLISSGVTCVVTAGNDSQNVVNASPGRVTAAITVGAMGKTDLGIDRVASFSNYGSGIDVFAPGVGIYAASHFSDTASNFSFGGTSAAAPHVAGVAARYLQRNPTASPAMVSLAITSNATIGKLGITHSPDRLLYSAFDMAWQPPPPPPPTCEPGAKEACEEFGGYWYASTCTCKSLCSSKPWLCE